MAENSYKINANADLDFVENLLQQMQDYDLEVANTGFGDMLHDTERNVKYEQALRAAINQVHAAGKKAHVLDIGTGTGIFAMMAVRAGADTVHACERFLPMANCAEKIFKLNNMSDKITLIKNISFEIMIGIDMPCKANILVAELLDTELIGEAALSIYNHAHAELLTNDVICIPNKAMCYVQLCNSSLADTWNRLKFITNDDCNKFLKPLNNILECRGNTKLNDMQVSMLPKENFQYLSEPRQIFEFDFSSKTPMKITEYKKLLFNQDNGICYNTVIFWWDIYFDVAETIKLSCAPIWARPADEIAKFNGKPITVKDIPWRDHWMQALFFLRTPPANEPLNNNNKQLSLFCCHDIYCFWFDIKNELAPECECGFHLSHSRNRIGQLNDLKRTKKYVRFITEKFVPEENSDNANNQKAIYNVLTLGDSCLIGLTHAWSSAVSKIYLYEEHKFSRNFISEMARTNSLSNIEIIKKKSFNSFIPRICNNITHIFAEPYFNDNELPWDNMGKFALTVYKMYDYLPTNVKISPYAIRLYAMPMEFDHLHKIRKPLGIVEGFDLKPFDEMLQESREQLPKFESHSLWEYSGTPLALPKNIHTYVLKETITGGSEGSINIERNGNINGIALWADVLLDDSENVDCIVSGGPTKPVKLDEPIEWTMSERQAVYFMPEIEAVSPEKKNIITFLVYHDPLKNQYRFEFKLTVRNKNRFK